MDFGQTREEEMLRNMVADFARTEVAPRVAELEEKGEFPHDIVKKMGELGMMGTVIDKEYGGSGMGHLARMITIEELSKVYASLGFYIQTGHLGMYLIQNVGTEEQKQKYLPPCVSGEKVMCCAVTEPSGGSDLGGLQTVAEQDGDDWVVNGRKVFISLGEVSDHITFLAKTGEKMTAFICDADTPGFKIGRREDHGGLRSLPVNELIFTDCKLTGENLIGEPNRGLGPTLNTIQNIGRTGAAAVSLGLAGAAYEASVKFAKERELYGKPIAKLQSLAFKLADMNTQIEAMKLLVYQAGWLIDQDPKGPEVSNAVCRAKTYASETAVEVIEKAIEIHGAYGTVPEYPLMRYMHDALPIISAAGTTDIMRMILSGSIIRQ